MKEKREELTDAELSVMEVLWDRPNGETVRDLVLAIYGRHEHSLHGGVKSFLDRLMEKGYVRVDKSEFAHRFFAVVSREETVGSQLMQIAESYFGGALTPILLTLIKKAKLKPKDRAEIERLIRHIQD